MNPVLSEVRYCTFINDMMHNAALDVAMDKIGEELHQMEVKSAA